MNQSQEDVTQYGKALTQALRAFQVLEPKAGWFERQLIKLLRSTYQQRLRVLIDELPSDLADDILKG